MPTAPGIENAAGIVLSAAAPLAAPHGAPPILADAYAAVASSADARRVCPQPGLAQLSERIQNIALSQERGLGTWMRQARVPKNLIVNARPSNVSGELYCHTLHRRDGLFVLVDEPGYGCGVLLPETLDWDIYSESACNCPLLICRLQDRDGKAFRFLSHVYARDIEK